MQSSAWGCSQGGWKNGQLEELGHLNNSTSAMFPCSTKPVQLPAAGLSQWPRNVYKRKRCPKLSGLGPALLHGRDWEGILLHFPVSSMTLSIAETLSLTLHTFTDVQQPWHATPCFSLSKILLLH